MKNLALFALSLLLCSSCAFCQLNSTSIEDLKASSLRALMVDSSANLESYGFSLDLDQNIEIINLSSGEAQEIHVRTFGFGSANMTDRALRLVMASITYANGDEENTAAMALEEYLINDSLYLKVDDEWTVLEMPTIAAAWSMQRTKEEQIDMLNRSKLSLIGMEAIGGEDCYKVKAEMDMPAYAVELSEQLASYIPSQPMNYTGLFQNMDLTVYYWIGKESHLLRRSTVIENFVLNPQSLVLPAKGPENQQMNVNSTLSVIYKGFNESVKIELPAEAGEAQPFPLNSVVSIENESIYSLENDMMINETVPNETILDDIVLNKTALNDTIPIEVLPNEMELNETVINETMINETVQAALTA